jgi:hypothetical protein
MLRLPESARGPGEHSCTQFAVLGLKAAARLGVEVPARSDSRYARRDSRESQT